MTCAAQSQKISSVPGGIVLFFLGFLSSVYAAEPDHRLRVLTSFVPLYCFAANVARDAAQVENLLPANISPHDYQFSRRDLQRVQEADVILVIGLGMEAWLDRLLKSSGQRLRVATATAGMEPDLIYGPLPWRGRSDLGSKQGLPNPHVWLDPALACQIVTNVLKALVGADPAHASAYTSNAIQYVAQLKSLDRDCERLLQPFRGQKIVTLHDAFPYFARRYGLEVAGVLEQVPDVDPSARYLKELQQVIRKQGVRAIFVEPQYSSTLAGQIAGDLNLKVAALDTLETGPLQETTYETVMRRNLSTLATIFSASHASKAKN